MATPFDRKLGLRLRELREQRKLSQLALARKLRVSSSAVQHWEHGRSSLNVVQVAQIAKALRVEPAAFSIDLFLH